jgi:hypothetical protein
MTAAGLPGSAPGVPRPGLSPLVAAAARSLLADGFRIVAFVLGAMLLSGVTLTAGAIGLAEVGGGLHSLLGPAHDSPAYPARVLSLVPIQAIEHVILVTVVVAYLGIRMPARMLAVSTVSEPSIRRGVAVVGAVLLVVLTWFVLPMRLTPILAVGVTLLPAAFAVAALRGPRRPPIAKGVRRYLLLTALFLVGSIATLGFVLTAPATGSDLSAFGEPASAAGLHADPEWTWRYVLFGQGGRIEGRTNRPRLSAADLARIASLRTEVRAAEVRDGELLLGELLVTSGTAAVPDEWDEPEWSMPAPKAPRLVGIFTIATLTDGREVILDPEPTVEVTPEWDGRLFGYWLGG